MLIRLRTLAVIASLSLAMLGAGRSVLASDPPVEASAPEVEPEPAESAPTESPDASTMDEEIDANGASESGIEPETDAQLATAGALGCDSDPLADPLEGADQAPGVVRSASSMVA